MKPQATRHLRNRQVQAASRAAAGLRAGFTLLKERAISLYGALPHPRIKLSALAAALIAFVALCVQGLAIQKPAELEEADWQPVELSLKAAEPVENHPVIEPSAGLTKETLEVKPGDSVSQVFKRAGYGPATVHKIAYETEHGERISRIFPGQTISFYTDAEGQLQKVRFELNKLEYYSVEREGDSFSSAYQEREPETYPRVKSGTIKSSFYLAGKSAKLTDKQIMELANIFGWDIDFVLEIRQGDRFTLVYEERYLDGEPISDGKILAAEFINKGRTFRAVRHTDEDGNSAFYNPEGKSMRKAFLRSPLDAFRISSHFNLNRKHPILNTTRAHKGTDYAAPTGTPVKATGDGKVVAAGRDGGYGNVIRIKHGQSYKTVYAHLHRFASGVKHGSYVRQGQTIGYVGSSGLATGPHLHYEFHLNGNVRNPVTVDLPDGEPIPADQLPDFEEQARPMLALLDKEALDLQYADATGQESPDI